MREPLHQSRSVHPDPASLPIEPTARAAGWAGVIAGVGLAVESGCWMASGWKPEVFADPSAALVFLHESGQWLRAAAFAGFINLAVELLWLAGLSAWVGRRSPTAGAAALYLGIVAVGAHSLVPVGLWLGVPSFVQLSSGHGDLAPAAWSGFSGFLGAAGGVGSLFAGLFLAVAGCSGWKHGSLPKAACVLAMLAALCSLAPVLGAGTGWQAQAGSLYLPGLLLVLLTRIATGVALLRSGVHASAAVPTQMSA